MSKIDLKSLSKAMQDARAQMKSHGEEAVMAACKGLFEQAPELKAITWLQYTPYFNDGDACVFHVHEVYPASVEEPGPYPDDDDEGFDLYTYSKDYKSKTTNYPWADAFEEVADLISSSDDLMQAAFGDHCQVTVTRKGVTVSEYEHD